MKVDGLGVVLAIILLPIILVVTYYVQMQVDTIATENAYNTKLLDATYDAMSAFEINTANEDLSSNADSMRSIILASNNVFFNTLATNFGVSNANKETLRPYIPAILYTMYDGYYIYSPTVTPKVAEKKEEVPDDENGDTFTTTSGFISFGEEYNGKKYDGEEVSVDESEQAVYGDVIYEQENGDYTVNRDHAKKDKDYILKSYVQYSGRYEYPDKVKPTIDVTINYTLDNYLNIEGKVGDIYYTKTGYLIKKGLVTAATVNTSTENNVNLLNFNEDYIGEKVLGKKTNNDETTIDAAKEATVIVNGITINVDWDNEIGNFINGARTISEVENFVKQNTTFPGRNDVIYAIQKYKAIAYYAKSQVFSNWVYDKLGSLKYKNIVDKATKDYYDNSGIESTSGTESLYYDFSNNDTSIFDPNEDPEDTESNFNTHKMEVIKNSIKYNLNLAMSAYNKINSSFEPSLPVLLDEEWDKILNNISIVSFMQGWDCGLDIYNNYQIVSSINNELTVNPDEIYYVEKDKFNNQDANYHRIDCNHWETGETQTDFIAFKSKEVKYDKIKGTDGKYKYDHQNLACYTCINTNNYESLFKKSNDSYYTDEDSIKKYTSFYDRLDSLADTNKKRAGYIGIAEERESIYKMNALPVSQGYRVFNENDSINLDDVVRADVTISKTKSNNGAAAREPVMQLSLFGEPVAVNLDQTKPQTVSIDLSAITGDRTLSPSKISPGYDCKYKIESIKIIYK